jgi:predicted Zn finger-like uncharacterized protein
MYTQCPECKTPHPITDEEINTSIGMTKCDGCSAMFDAQESLNEGTMPNETDIDEFISYLDSSIPTKTNYQSKWWGLGSGFLLLIFIFQAFFFEAYNLSQNISLRPWLKKTCASTPFCQFPHYKNLAEFNILNSSFKPESDHYLFKIVYINRSIFSQRRPSIKLSLIDFTGHTFATRIFYPEIYSKQATTLLKPNIPEQTALTIATPTNKVGGYRIELI